MKRHLVLTADELVAYLKRTSLVTVLVEGTADAFVYRCLEGKLSAGDVLVCSGRDTLLRVFERKAEFIGATAVFVADRDMWHFTGIPDKYRNGVVFTSGYSIENDLYLSEVFEALLDDQERSVFGALLDQLAIWFAAAVEKYKATGSSDCSAHISRVCPDKLLCEQYKAIIGFVDPDAQLVQNIRQDYRRSLRGKSLFEAVVRFLSHSQRQSKFSKSNLMELGSKMPNQRIDLLISQINVASATQ